VRLEIHTNFLPENLKEDHRKDLGKDNINIDLKDKVCEGVEWSHLAQDREQCCDLVNTVMNLWVQ
jgi:hypothetical protein